MMRKKTAAGPSRAARAQNGTMDRSFAPHFARTRSPPSLPVRRQLEDGTRRVVAVSYARGALDSFTSGVDGAISLDVAKTKGYLESADPDEQAYYNDLLAAMEMDTDDARGGLTPDATPYDEQ
jgi:hypothetical protein